DRTAAVGGVVRVLVRVRRRRVTVLAAAGYGAPEQVRAEVVRVVQAALPELGPARTPPPRVRLRAPVPSCRAGTLAATPGFDPARRRFLGDAP
ncbi:DUF6286 domain-containing protein, partial [Streptomyces griseus]|uniref:DUF6286 domain-containing protein n=1 Tax=Streptomyces griseus TaxID=1911 RepID=UPI00214CE0EC